MQRGSESEGSCRVLRTSVAMIEQSYARYIGSDFLASLMKPTPAPEAAKAAESASQTGRSTGRSAHPKTKPPGSPAVREWRRGELNPRPRAVRLERLRSLVRDLI